MTRTLASLLSTLVLLGLVAPRAQAAGLPIVISATVDYTDKTVTISGENFGSSPTVKLDSMTFPTMTAASKQIVADFHGAKSAKRYECKEHSRHGCEEEGECHDTRVESQADEEWQGGAHVFGNELR